MAKARTDSDRPSRERSWSFEVVNLEHSQRQQWGILLGICRKLTNKWWQEWETRHVVQGNVDRLEEYVAAYAQWKKSCELLGTYQKACQEFERLWKRDRPAARQAFRGYFGQAGLPLVDVASPPPPPQPVQQPRPCPVPAMPDETLETVYERCLKRWKELQEAKTEETRAKAAQAFDPFFAYLGEPIEDVTAPPSRPGKKRGEWRRYGESSIYAKLANTPLGKTLPTASITALFQRSFKQLTGKDKDGKWQLWQAILLGRQGRPRHERDQPIPFGRVNCTAPVLVQESENDAVYECQVSVLRRERPGKRTCETIIQPLRFYAKKGGLAIARRLASGEYRVRGSRLIYKKSERKWFVSFSFSMPGVEGGAPGTAERFLVPAASHPWNAWIPGRWTAWRLGDAGHYVARARTRNLQRRQQLQTAYRHAGSNRSGHGRVHALEPLTRLRDSWRMFVTRTNRKMVARLIKDCQEKGVGVLYFYQPVEAARDSRFLSTAGELEDIRDSSFWDWCGVARWLAEKCQEAHIEFVLIQVANAEVFSRIDEILEASPVVADEATLAWLRSPTSKGEEDAA